MATYQGDWATRRSDEEGYAYDAFKRFFGREPTETELAQATSAYASGDRNRPNVQGGDAFVAQMYENINNSPDKQYAREQEELLKKAPEHYGAIDDLYQQFVGRTASQNEKDHFGKLLASGQVDAYTLSNFLQQLPETVKKQDAQFRESLRQETSQADERYFNERVLPGIQQNFARAGRSFDGTAFANAAAQSAQQQNVAREGFLTNLTADQYSGNKANAYNDYLNSVGRLQAGQDYTRGRRDQLTDAMTGRLYDIQNFSMQKQAYDDYLKRYGKRGSPLASGLSGAIGGATVGATAGGPWGAVAGGLLGGGLGAWGGQ